MESLQSVELFDKMVEKTHEPDHIVRSVRLLQTSGIADSVNEWVLGLCSRHRLRFDNVARDRIDESDGITSFRQPASVNLRAAADVEDRGRWCG